jgi:hypothetical protein
VTLSAQVLKDATFFFSHSTPNLTTIIPAINFINDKLTAHAHDQMIEPSLQPSKPLWNFERRL